jgi:hypothetical protein
MLVPTIVRRVDHAARTKDAAELDGMAEALKQYVIRTKTVPSDLPAAIKDHMVLPLGKITTTPRGTSRTFLIDPSFSISGGLPYRQGTGGTIKPSSARALIVSCLESNAPNGDFDTLWATADTDAMRIKRINLEPLFHQLILVNRDNTLPPKFSLDTNNIVDVISGGGGTNRYFIQGSALGLYGTNSALVTRHIITENISFVFESGSWRAQLMGSITNTTADPNGDPSQAFAATAAEFFASTWNSTAITQGGKGGSQSAVLGAMYNFMSAYSLWANQSPKFNRYGRTLGTGNDDLPIYLLLKGEFQNIETYGGEGNWGLLH